MDISPSDYPWNKRSDYPWDEGQDLQDIICSIEEDFPSNSFNGEQPYISPPYNGNPLFEMFNNTQAPQTPLTQASPYPAPALPAPTPFSLGLVPGPSAPAPAAPAASTSASNPAPPINFIMVMDGEKGKRISKRTGVIRSKRTTQTPPTIKDFNPLKPLDDPKIVLIINEVKQNILEATVRGTRLTDQKDREEMVKSELTAAAQKHFPTDANSVVAWTKRNWNLLYNDLSKPLAEIMRKLKSTAQSLYIQGYGLRPPARSPDALNENNYAQGKVQQLIPPESPELGEFASLAFIYDDQSNPLEHPVIWSVVLDTVKSLGYSQYVGGPESLDHLFKAAASAVYCCLDQCPKGKKLQFTKVDHAFIYHKVGLFLEQVIYADEVLTSNWIEYRHITHTKLTT